MPNAKKSDTKAKNKPSGAQTDNSAPPLMFDEIKKTIAESVHRAIKEINSEASIHVEAIYSSLDFPPDPKLGEYSFAAFAAAPVLRQAPPKIATQIAEKLQGDENFHEVTVVDSFVNFVLSHQLLAEHVLEPIREGAFFEKQLFADPPKTMIEFSQPNTHKELHVGHMRNISLGDALIRLHRYCGFEVVSTTFPGDVGTHVAKCLWYFEKHNQEPVPEDRKGAWLGKLYTAATLKLEQEKDSPAAQENQKDLTEILKQLERKEGHYYDLWLETREWSIEVMERVYKWANVTFDQWYWESEVDSDSLALVKRLHQEGRLSESEGAVGMDLEDQGLGFCLLMKSDGNGLYATKDLLLAQRKFEDHNIQKNVYIVDLRQSYHFQQVFAVLAKLGYEQAAGCYHLPYNYVELPDGAMSSRKGNIVALEELIERMESAITTNYLERYRGDWSDEEISSTASNVARGAIKFGMNQTAPGTKIVFDMDQWLKIEGESGPYVQYVYARIRSIIRRAGLSETAPVSWNVLEGKNEKALMVKLADFNNVIARATEAYKTNALCKYLYEVSKQFNAFYADSRVLDDTQPEISQARVALCDATARTIKKGLELLGIPAPEKM